MFLNETPFASDTSDSISKFSRVPEISRAIEAETIRCSRAEPGGDDSTLTGDRAERRMPKKRKGGVRQGDDAAVIKQLEERVLNEAPALGTNPLADRSSKDTPSITVPGYEMAW